MNTEGKNNVLVASDLQLARVPMSLNTIDNIVRI